VPGLLLAGEYPGGADAARTRDRLERFVAAGVRTFVNLTEEHELDSYDRVLEEIADRDGVEIRHVRFAIRDHDVPAHGVMPRILDEIRCETAAGRPVYVHCYGGIGRTGTVVGCWLVEGGLASDEALLRIIELRQAVPDRTCPSPETKAQRHAVFEWGEQRSREQPGRR
jgi:protein-tyrosine phosphatase